MAKTMRIPKEWVNRKLVPMKSFFGKTIMVPEEYDEAVEMERRLGKYMQKHGEDPITVGLRDLKEYRASVLPLFKVFYDLPLDEESTVEIQVDES